MTEISQIVKSIEKTSKSFPEITDYPNEPGIYAFSLLAGSNMNNFGKSNQVIYVGIAKDSLRTRDLGNHFRTGRTGSSTLRRSIGAVLKSELKLTARSRNGTADRRAINLRSRHAAHGGQVWINITMQSMATTRGEVSWAPSFKRQLSSQPTPKLTADKACW